MICERASERGCVGFYRAESQDGVDFRDVTAEPVFVAAAAGSWECQISTARLFVSVHNAYMIYGGSPGKIDQPEYFGLARSRDLVEWERHPGNPVLGCGARGSEDGGAIWFPDLIESDDRFYLLYEGSRGDYAWDLSSQICLASIGVTHP